MIKRRGYKPPKKIRVYIISATHHIQEMRFPALLFHLIKSPANKLVCDTSSLFLWLNLAPLYISGIPASAHSRCISSGQMLA